MPPCIYWSGSAICCRLSFCYALGGTYSRKAIQNRIETIIAAAGAMTVTAIISGNSTMRSPYLGGAASANAIGIHLRRVSLGSHGWL